MTSSKKGGTPREWLDRANTDLTSSELLYSNSIYSNSLFLLQQAVEKGAKAFLVTFNEFIEPGSLLGRYVKNQTPTKYGHQWEKGFVTRMSELASFASAFYPEPEEYTPGIVDLPADYTKNLENFKKFSDEKELRKFVEESKRKIISNLAYEMKICKQIVKTIEKTALNYGELGSQLEKKLVRASEGIDSLLLSSGFNRRARRILLGKLRYFIPSKAVVELVPTEELAKLKTGLKDRKIIDKISEMSIRSTILLPLLILGLVLNPFAIESRYPGSFQFDSGDPVVSTMPDMFEIARDCFACEERLLTLMSS